ncbi:MAG: NUDIX hydrolase [Alphaproteobacteria bacterium]
MDFVGAKAALFCGSGLLTCQRDETPGLRWPGLWDLPGGGREGLESPEDCLLRELWEEFGLRLTPDRLVRRRVFPSMVEAARTSVFFGGWVTQAEVASIRFGDEGQGWDLMPVVDFLSHHKAVPEMQRRVGIVWEEMVEMRGPDRSSASNDQD